MLTKINKIVREVTDNIIERSSVSRKLYLDKIQKAQTTQIKRDFLSCGNIAHSIAGCNLKEKNDIALGTKPNIGIVSAYNDMLSAHKPYESYPTFIKKIITKNNGTCQFAGGVPAMCDGVTQGQVGMELSLFSRDVIAQSTAIALSHNVFDGALMLGICDKIVPGLLMGCLSFGHLPVIFVPAGPMPTGISNKEKKLAREAYINKKLTKSELLEVESKSYHSPGTCTFYGTANTNQLLLELMGLMLPGAAFINPEENLRSLFTKNASKRIIELSSEEDKKSCIGKLVNEKSIVNAIVGLLASGGSTNLTIHLVAIAKFAGITINWEDFGKLSKVTPIITNVYPNGEADINEFHKAGGTSFLVKELSENGLIHNDIRTINENRFEDYLKRPEEKNNKIIYKTLKNNDLDKNILRPFKKPFSSNGGINVVTGNIGKGIVKISSVKSIHQKICEQAEIFETPEEFSKAFEKGSLNKNCVVVIRGQGPKSNGMPELHSLNPILSVIQNLGYRIALITDGRMSGASGSVLTVVHVNPETNDGGVISKIKKSDFIEIDAQKGTMNVKISNKLLDKRLVSYTSTDYSSGYGRELFKTNRHQVTSSDTGAISIG